MLLRAVLSSLRHRARLYLPMVVAVAVSLSLLGSAGIVGSSFDEVVDREMRDYGANVFIRPDGAAPRVTDEHVEVALDKSGEGFVVAETDVDTLIEMNPAWLVRGNGTALVGADVAKRLNVSPGSTLRVDGETHRASVLVTGTEFDSFVVIEGRVSDPSLILVRAEDPSSYRGEDAEVLQEMVKAKYRFLGGVRELLLYVAILSGLASGAAVVNLARMDAGSRRREFGVLEALGARRTDVAKLVGAEFAALSGATAALGVLGSLGLSWAILSLDAGVAPSVGTEPVLQVIGTSFVAFGAAGSIYVLESSRSDPADEIAGDG